MLLYAQQEEDDDEDVKISRSSAFRALGMGSMNSPSGKKGKGKAGAQSDVDIYNIINAEEKDTGSKKRKGLALGQVCMVHAEREESHHA